MENDQQTQGLFELQFDESAKSSVITMARWALIIVITSVIGYILTLVKYFKQKSEMQAMMGGEEYDFQSSYVSTAQTTGLVTIIITVLIGLLITYFLYQFSSKAKSGMESMSSYEVNVGFANFKNYFLVIGILMILGIIFVGFAIITAIAMAGRYN